MKKKISILGFLLLIPLLASSAGATIIGVSELAGPSSMGTSAAIIPAPANILDDDATNTGMQGFDEAQGVTLSMPYGIDGGTLAPRLLVDSHMIFLNSEGNALVSHYSVEWTFSGSILGIMSDSGGTLEAASSSELGASGTNYPSAFTARGLESHLDGTGTNDGYTITGSNTLLVGMRVTEPGDWIRVVTTHNVPEPSTLLLIGSGLAGLGFARRYLA